MAFTYTHHLIGSALTYDTYREQLDHLLDSPPVDETAAKMRPYIIQNVKLMKEYDSTYTLSNALRKTLNAAPAAIWLVLTEGWCGDAAFNVPMLRVIERTMPEKVQLRILLRDSNPDVMDANLTDGGRSIPKLVVLSEELQPLGAWGPRPAGLQTLMKEWKAEGLGLKEIIPKVHAWYNGDQTNSLQSELEAMIAAYS